MEHSSHQKHQAPKKGVLTKPWVQTIVGIILIGATLGGFLYWKANSPFVYIEMSQISAPVINIGPEAQGVLTAVYVKPGDTVTPNESVAQVGSEILSAKVAGRVITTQNTPGQVFAPGTPVVSMIVPSELRVVGKLDEDKGLSRIKVGDPVYFTVDSFGGTQFTGVVDEISPTSDQSSVVFSISDKRPVRQFDVKIRYDVATHPEFRNGMSAKIYVYAGQSSA